MSNHALVVRGVLLHIINFLLFLFFLRFFILRTVSSLIHDLWKIGLILLRTLSRSAQDGRLLQQIIGTSLRSYTNDDGLSSHPLTFHWVELRDRVCKLMRNLYQVSFVILWDRGSMHYTWGNECSDFVWLEGAQHCVHELFLWLLTLCIIGEIVKQVIVLLHKRPHMLHTKLWIVWDLKVDHLSILNKPIRACFVS